MPCIFLSYRRDDTAGFVGRLGDSLEAAFGQNIVFRDIDDLEPDVDVATAIEERLRSADALLLLIGPRWLSAEEDGRPRLHDEGDPVRQEIEAAQRMGKRIIPVLVDGASMPAEEDLPSEIDQLAERNAFTISEASWSSDVERLVSALRPGFPVVAGPPRQQISQSWLITGALLASLAVLGAFLLTSRFWLPEPPTVVGSWVASVDYGRGVIRDEYFEFRLTGRDLSGTATFLGSRRAIDNARLEDDRLSFETRSRELIGNEQRELRHQYEGVLEGERIRFSMQTTGGFTEREPVQFEATRRVN